jgi:hypothetical protein
VFDRIWAMLVEKWDELGDVDWQWQSIDCAVGKARKGGTWSAQTPRIVPNAA